MARTTPGVVYVFQSTRPIRGATAQSIITTSAPTNFNPRAPYGARRTAEGGKLYKITFQSTRPIRGATWPTRPYAPHSTAFQSTRPIRGATGAETLQDYLHLFQSTRPIRGATGMDNSGKTTLVFQSTRPIRGATIIHYSLSFPSNLYFNPRAPYGARPLPSLLRHWIRTYFNPRAPYGARLRSLSSSSVSYTFQSTRPIRGATRGRPHFCGRGPISIHAPHTGRDLLWSRY